jgi:hypothetical protein
MMKSRTRFGKSCEFSTGKRHKGLIGLREALGDSADKLIVTTQTYETTDPTVDSQIVALQASGANVLVTAAIA